MSAKRTDSARYSSSVINQRHQKGYVDAFDQNS
jgi:hypothetical protein